MLCSYDDLCYIICTVLRGRYCVIQHSRCNTNKTIIIIKRVVQIICLPDMRFFVKSTALCNMWPATDDKFDNELNIMSINITRNQAVYDLDTRQKTKQDSATSSKPGHCALQTGDQLRRAAQELPCMPKQPTPDAVSSRSRASTFQRPPMQSPTVITSMSV